MDLHEDINYRIILNDSMNIRIETKYNPRILVDIDQFELNQNRITFLFGESGIGKSIIARAIYGLLDDEILNIKINTHSYKKYLQQDFVKQAHFVVAVVSDNSGLVRSYKERGERYAKQQAGAAIENFLRIVNTIVYKHS